MNIETVIQAGGWGVFILGVLAFLTALIVQMIKELPGIQKAPTSIVAMAVAFVLTLTAFFGGMAYLEIKVVWYMVAAAVVACFLVWYIAVNGWDKFHELWERFRKEAPKK